MLVITTTVRMIDWVHSNTTSLGPGVPLDGKLVLRSRRLCIFVSHLSHPNMIIPHTEHRLVCSSTTCNNPDHTSSRALDDLLRTTGQLDSCLSLIRIVTDDRAVVARRSAQSASITSALFQVCDNGTFWKLADREDVTNSQIGILPSVDELTGVHALVRDEGLLAVRELVRVSEGDLR